MSASERLRELDFGTTADDSEISMMGHNDLLALRNALPEIVAVVDAAERFTAAVDYSIEHGLNPSLAEATAERVRLDEMLRPALSALEKKLTPRVQNPSDELGGF